MMKKKVLSLLPLVWLLGSAIPAEARPDPIVDGWQVYFDCRGNSQCAAVQGGGSMTGYIGPVYDSEATCVSELNAVKARNGVALNSRCVQVAGGSGVGNLVTSPFGTVVYASAAGLLGGSLFTSAAGYNQAMNGAMAAGGAMTVIQALSNAPKLPLAAGVIVAGAGAAVSAYGVAKYNEEQGTLAPDKTPMVVGASAAAGATMFLLKKSVGGSKPQWAPRFLGPNARLDFPVSLPFTGLRLRW